MSHVANLKARQQAIAKRRKLSSGADSSALTNGLLNGLVNGSTSLHATPTKNAKSTAASQHDETKVSVGHGNVDAIMIDDSEDDDAEEDEDEDDEDEEDEDEDEEEADEHQANGHPESDLRSKHKSSDEEVDGAQPTFGDLLRERGQEPVSVDLTQDALALSRASAASGALSQHRALSIPTATSLGTVLTQALRTNDVDLLESCLQVPNLESIRATIERLHSSHAATLLQKLAERMHKRPGRAGSLMVWIQWTVVAHGGYLASQPAAMNELHTLYRVVRQRASGLQPLLALKGKLDMLEAQMQLRRNMQKRSADEQDDGVIYIEGQDDVEAEAKSRRKQITNDALVDADSSDEQGSDEELDELPNGVDDALVNGASDDEDEDEDEGDEEDADLLDEDDEEEEEEEEDSDEDDLIDDEAEETDNDSEDDASDEDEIEYDMEDGSDLGDEVSDSEDERRAAKKTKSSSRI